MIEVRFQYDERLKKWDPLVVGASDPDEAREAFAAVILTCQMLNPKLLKHTRITRKSIDNFQVQPAV